jgi:hypothetical protein
MRSRQAEWMGTTLAAALLALTACAWTPTPVDDEVFVGTYVAQLKGSPEIEIGPSGELGFSNFESSWIGGDSTEPLSGSGNWTPGSQLHNGYTAFAADFVAPPEIPGRSTWIYVRDNNSVFLWLDVNTDERIEFQRVG